MTTGQTASDKKDPVLIERPEIALKYYINRQTEGEDMTMMPFKD